MVCGFHVYVDRKGKKRVQIIYLNRSYQRSLGVQLLEFEKFKAKYVVGCR